MRSRNAILFAALGIPLAFYLTRETEAQVLNDPALDIFDSFNSRELARHPPTATMQTFRNSPIAKIYANLDPKRSILISDCKVFDCDHPGFLSFSNVFQLAAAANQPNRYAPSANDLYTNLVSSLYQLDHTLSRGFHPPLASETFQFLALANRMDMASWDGSTWNGAEMHFVYGATSVPDFTVILEFALAPDRMTGFSADQFRTLGAAWIALSDKRLTAAAYPAKLHDALVASGLPLDGTGANWIKSVRIRINHDYLGANWQFAQMKLDPMTSRWFLPERLPDQIRADITSDGLARLWTAAQASLKKVPGSYAIPPDLFEKPAVSYASDGDTGMPTPPGLCGEINGIRKVLAGQQCTGCHTAETCTKFRQIANRATHTSSALSQFLQGGGDLHPSLVDLYNRVTRVAPVVKVKYQTYSGPGCMTAIPAAKPSESQFHDIARRTLFLASVPNDFVLSRGKRIPVAQQFSSNSIE